MRSNHFFPLLAAMAVVAVGMANAQLQDTNIRAEVPFAFIAGTEHFPPGQYTVRRISDVGSLAIFGNGSAMVIAWSNVVESLDPQKVTKLVFHRYGGRYFLCQVWVQGENQGRELPKTSLESELARSRQPVIVAVLAGK